MKIEEMKPPSPWQPEQDKVHLALLGKLGEELNEAGAIVSRCIIQGIGECEPVTKEPNIEALEDEMGDVLAGFMLVQSHFDLDINRILRRQAAKIKHLREWHAMLKG